MQIIVWAIIIYFVIRFIKKKSRAKKENEQPTYEAPAAGSRAEKAAIREFKKELKIAKGYGAEALEAKEKIRDFCEKGYGTQQDLALAARWNMDAAMEAMRLKVIYSEYEGVKESPGYLYGNFKWFTEHGFLNKANELAMLALTYGYSSSSSMVHVLDHIRQEKLTGQPVEKGEERDFKSVYGTYLAAQAGIRTRSERVYREWLQEIGSGKTLARKIDLVLEKAGWNVNETGAAAGTDLICDQKFREAYALEQRGENFKKVAELYESLAGAGNHEAQRRLAHLCCNVFSACINDENDRKGMQLLTQSAQAGNAMSAYEVGQEFELAQITAWAKEGYRDALVTLGSLLERGSETCRPNWDASQIVFHLLYDEIGDAAANRDGEGLWIQLALGKKMGNCTMTFINEMVRKGNEIGYAPAQFDYAHRTRVVAVDASNKYAKVTGAEGRYSEYYNRLVWESSLKPIEAGYAKAVALSRYHREQEEAIDRYVRSCLSDAEQEKGGWSVGFSDWGAERRVAFEAAKIQKSLDAASTVRMAYGQISFSGALNALIEKREYHPDAWISKISEQQTVDAAEAGCKTSCPSYITDDMGRIWSFDGIVLGGVRFRLPEGNFVNPQFDLGDSLGREVFISDAELQKGSAKTIGRTFRW